MRLTQAIGLTAVAAVVAMAFIGTSSAFATKDSVVICRDLVAAGNLCLSGHLWPSGSTILGLATNVELHNFAVAVKCPDSLIEIKTLADSGLSLPVEITKLESGTLPTPSLGSGCTGCTALHTKVPWSGSLGVTPTDLFKLTFTGEVESLGCPGGLTCAYGVTNGVSKTITHSSSHANHPSATNLALIPIELTMTKTLGSVFCPASNNWLASYTIYLVHGPTPESGLGWPALDNPVIP